MDEQIAPRFADQSEGEQQDESLAAQLGEWMRNQLPWWAISFTLHVAALASLLLLGRFTLPNGPHDDAAMFLPPERVESNDDSLKPFEVGAADIVPKPIDLETPPQIIGSPDAELVPPAPGEPGEPAGDSTSSSVKDSIPSASDFAPKTPGPGPALPNRLPRIPGTGTGDPYILRPNGGPPSKGVPGSSHDSERAVTAAIYWLAQHQARDGSWSLQDFVKRCRDKTCTGIGAQESVSGATAMGVLPFLGVGQTHVAKGKLQPSVARAIYWLISHQKPDGDLSAGASQQMYSHALATIALCEDYGMTRDKTVGLAAQKALNFIQSAQNSKTRGWRYHPGEEGDTSVTGWQLMALTSGQVAKLHVNQATFDGVKRWLSAVAKTAPGESSGGSGQFSYQPEGAATPTMSAVGLLCSQYLRAGRADPVIVGGVQYLMANPPEEDAQNVYYWYYAAQVMHNMNDKDWDTWNHKLRTILVQTQTREGCAAGSWDPDKPVRDAWGPAGGRLMVTSLSALTLEVYYRYLPLYQLDTPEQLDPLAR